MGEMLLDMPKNPGAVHEASLSQSVTATPPKLEELGITRNDSSRCQTIAKLPEETFEEHIHEVTCNGLTALDGL